LLQMQACGHFEFGLDRRVINFGDAGASESVERLWKDGEDVRGYARCWAQVYGFLARRLAANEALRRAAIVVRFEDLCGQSLETVQRVAEHCELADDRQLHRELADRLHAPTYYQAKFSPAEYAAIEDETREVAGEF